MKTTPITLLMAALLLVSLNRCTRFLEVENTGKSTITSFFSDMDGLRAASEGMHRTILDFYDSHFLLYPALAGDLADIVRLNASEMITKVHDYNNAAEDNAGYPRLIWKNGYVINTNANNILYYGEHLKEKYPQHIDEINTIFAQALFARALATFDLCLVYGQPYGFTPDASHWGVPVVTRVPGFDDMIARNTVADVYRQVIKDLMSAMDLFGGKPARDVYHASATACQALLARVCLYKGDWEGAAAHAKAVMDQVPLSPRQEYEKMFRGANSTTGAESIFRLNAYNAGGSMKNHCDPAGTVKVVPSAKLLALFTDPQDIRGQMLTYTPEDNETQLQGQHFSAFTKYCAYKSITNEKERRYDPFVFRCSEMYLIHAEALCRQNNPDPQAAALDIKALQARATGKPVRDISLHYTSIDDLLNIILRERCKELYTEGHRLFDLLRLGHDLQRGASSSSWITSLPYPDYRFVLPICSAEMDANEAMIQNTGYTGR